ncbi:probable carboxylesterase 17 [Nymphaea colorata]|uniref:probable carboxylesterase 17 n=1 Tax=Nymphaea colorata TaxID=210225 RepID=UPI00129EB042|nr:probable carboxylesterase 17 [Nymphaea colorata]
MSIVAEIPGFIQIFSDGTVTRFSPEIAQPSPVVSRGYKSKDIVINPLKPISARIFLPQTADSAPLPVVLYFHGGGFCFGSTTWLGYHYFLGTLCTKSQCIVLSVEYRLAPEHRIPAAYEDCHEAVTWLSSKGSAGDEWLSQADLRRVFLMGDSAGANIVHHVCLRVLSSKAEKVKIGGLSLIHPYFGSEERLEKESTEATKVSDALWQLSLPVGSNRDHFACNFETAEDGKEVDWSKFPATLVHVAGEDLLSQRGVMYEGFLKRKAVKEVELVLQEGQPHVYFLFSPEDAATTSLHEKLYQFIHRLD